jgi:hypothetical protein
MKVSEKLEELSMDMIIVKLMLQDRVGKCLLDAFVLGWELVAGPCQCISVTLRFLMSEKCI